MKHQLKTPGLEDLSTVVTSTVTTDPSILFFTAVQLQPSIAKQVKIVISGVSSTARTSVTASEFYEILSSTNIPLQTLTVTGNVAVTLSVKFKGNVDVSIVDGQLTISGSEIANKTVTLSTAVTPNPSIFPSALFFSTVQDVPSLSLKLNLTISNVSSGAKTFVEAPDFYQLSFSDAPDAIRGKTIALTGTGIFTLFVRFAGSVDAGNFIGEIKVTGDEIIDKTVPVKTTVLATPTPTVNPGILSGFTAVEAGAPSVAQSFDLSVKGLPVQGKPVVTITAPKGYSIALSSVSSFGGAFVVFAENGTINRKIFVRLNGSNPVGPINGNVTITGAEINTKTVKLKGEITPNPQPVLTVDKTSLTGFITTTNKPSIAQSYKLQATNLPTGVAATVKAPTGYEVSLTNTANSIFSSQVTILQVAGSINTTVFVRLKSQATAGNLTGVIQNTVAGLTKDVNVSGSVVLQPSISVNPTSLAGFTTVKNQASVSKSYNLVVSNLTAGETVTINAPVNYELRLQGAGAFASSLTVNQNSAGTINQTIEVRLKSTETTGTINGIIQHLVTGLIRFLNVSGFVSAPALITTVSSLSFVAIKNQASTPKSYKVMATNLATGLKATITASAAYEISLKSGGAFANSLTLQQNITNGISTEVFVRLKATAATGFITGSLQHSVAGLSKVVNLSATVTAPTVSADSLV